AKDQPRPHSLNGTAIEKRIPKCVTRCVCRSTRQVANGFPLEARLTRIDPDSFHVLWILTGVKKEVYMNGPHRMFLVLALLSFLATGASAQCVAPTCTEVIHNGPAGTKQVLVVLGDGYAAGDQTKFNNDVQSLVLDGVFGHDFFQEEQNAFNVFRLNLVSHDSGVSQRVYDEHGTPTNGADDTITSTTLKDTALRYIWSGSWAHCWLEGSADTGTRVQNALAASVPNYNYVVVLLNQDSYGGCGGGGFQIVPRGVTWPGLAP